MASAVAAALMLLALAPGAVQAQGPIVDEFGGSSLDTTVWTFVNPLGDASVSVGSGRASISLPTGSSHDIWGTVNTGVGLRTAMPNRNFELEAKYDTAVTRAFQMQGIVVEQDSDDLLRAEVHYDGKATRLYVATMAAGVPKTRYSATVAGGAPAYVRVLRTGDQWQVKYSRDGSTWTVTPAFTFALNVVRAGPHVGNSGNPAPAWTAELDRFREVVPDAVAPQISAVAASGRTIDATVTWTTDEPASSQVAFGPTSLYGNTLSVSGLTTSHSVVLHGLACGTQYHFQAQSTDSANNTRTGADQTFTTAACPGVPQSDEFGGTAIDFARWTFVDPAGGAAVGAGDGQGRISLPAGVAHDTWTNNDKVARLLQSAPNDNFDMLAKFDSAVSLTYQMQGFLVQQDTDDLLRLEVHKEGAFTNLFAASITAGAASTMGRVVIADGAPVYLRLRRVGDRWTLSYSPDGLAWPTSITFTRAMTVTGVGLLAGNSGLMPPSFEERIDWFRFIPPDRTPPVLGNDITATPGAGSTAKVAWTTDEPATSEVAFGATSAYELGTIASGAEVTQHGVTLHGLRCESTYHYRVRSVDVSGNATEGNDRTLTTGACAELLESDEFDGTALDSGKWAFIDPLGDGSSSVGGGTAAISVPAGRAHDLWSTVRTVPRLLQAAPDRDFEVVVKFATAPATGTQQQGLVVEESHTRLLRFETFHDGSGTRLFAAGIADGSAEVLHNSAVPGGAPSYLKLRRIGDRWTVSYSNDGEAWRSASFDRALDVTAVGPYVGNGGKTPPAFEGRIEYFHEITDRVSPVITQVEARPMSRQAQVTWTTDELSSSVVEYRQGTGAWQSSSAPNQETRHSAVASGLACGTTYSYRVRSVDGLGNVAVSPASTLTTAPCTASGGPDVDVWNGDSQTFGEVGIPQTWVNITGNVSDPDGVQSITGALNEGGRESLGFTPDGWRIQRPGDFNYEVNIDELYPGPNRIVLRATDSLGNVTTRQVTVNWQGRSAGPPADPAGPLMVIAAHPDDDVLSQSGVIDTAKRAGRRVIVAFATNGEGGRVATTDGDCGAPEDAAPAARYGLVRDGEGRDALGVLGLQWHAALEQTELVYLGYPGTRIAQLAATENPLINAASGVQRTYAEDFDGNPVTCNGDFRYQLDGSHSVFKGSDLKDDLDELLAYYQPADVYTHVAFDGHTDHAEIARQVRAALRRANAPRSLHMSLQHPAGDTRCANLSAARWPNPALTDNDPFARFTPTIVFTAPPAEPCNEANADTDWGPLGPPNESVEVPASMQDTSEAANKKWQAISKHQTQIDCVDDGNYHVNCGYMRAFVKRNEPFWRADYGVRRTWTKPYTTNFSSTASIARETQILEGQWRFEGDGVRPVTTGFDRALILGDTGWIDYEVHAPFTIHSFNPTATQGAAVGLAVGWQGHNAWGQPRHGHPGGGLCLYARGNTDTSPYKLQIGYSPGPVHDTTLATKELSLATGVEYEMRFRQQDIGQAGSTRYSCKVWRAGQPEPTAWDLVTDIPDWPGTTDQRPGSAVLLAHEVDTTFGDATVNPLP